MSTVFWSPTISHLHKNLLEINRIIYIKKKEVILQSILTSDNAFLLLGKQGYLLTLKFED